MTYWISGMTGTAGPDRDRAVTEPDGSGGKPPDGTSEPSAEWLAEQEEALMLYCTGVAADLIAEMPELAMLPYGRSRLS